MLGILMEFVNILAAFSVTINYILAPPLLFHPKFEKEIYDEIASGRMHWLLEEDRATIFKGYNFIIINYLAYENSDDKPSETNCRTISYRRKLPYASS